MQFILVRPRSAWLDRLVYYEYRGWLRPEPPAADVRAGFQRRLDRIRQQPGIQ